MTCKKMTYTGHFFKINFKNKKTKIIYIILLCINKVKCY